MLKDQPLTDKSKHGENGHAVGWATCFWQSKQKTLPPNFSLLNQQNLATLY